MKQVYREVLPNGKRRWSYSRPKSGNWLIVGAVEWTDGQPDYTAYPGVSVDDHPHGRNRWESWDSVIR